MPFPLAHLVTGSVSGNPICTRVVWALNSLPGAASLDVWLHFYQENVIKILLLVAFFILFMGSSRQES